MAEQPPQYAQYPRGEVGSYQELEDLTDGYFGLRKAFLVNVVLSISTNVAFSSTTVGQNLGFDLACLGLIGVPVFFVTLAPNRKIGRGLGWAPLGAVLASLLMALNSVFCCGTIGYLVMQKLAFDRMKRYGFATSLFGLKKPLVQMKLAKLQAKGEGDEQKCAGLNPLPHENNASGPTPAQESSKTV